MINQICDSSLLIGYAVEARSIGIGVVKEVINDMNVVYKPEKTRSIFFFHEWRWPITLTTAALLIILVVAILVFNRSFFTRDWGPGNELVFDRAETLMEKHDADSQAKYLVSGDIKPIDGGVSGLDNEKGSLQGKMGRTNRYPIPARNREPVFEVIESHGPEDEEFISQRYLSKVIDGDVGGKKELKGSTVEGLERDSAGGPLSGEETVLGQDTGVVEGYYKVRKGDTLSKIAGRKDVYGDTLRWPSLFRLNLDKLSRMNVRGDFEHKELPEGLHLKFVTPEEAKKNLARLDGKPWVVNALSAKTSDEIVPSAVKLIKNGYHVYMTKTKIKGEEWIRLRVGFFETPSKAESVQNDVVSLLNVDGAWVTKIGRELERYGGY